MTPEIAFLIGVILGVAIAWLVPFIFAGLWSDDPATMRWGERRQQPVSHRIEPTVRRTPPREPSGGSDVQHEVREKWQCTFWWEPPIYYDGVGPLRKCRQILGHRSAHIDGDSYVALGYEDRMARYGWEPLDRTTS